MSIVKLEPEDWLSIIDNLRAAQQLKAAQGLLDLGKTVFDSPDLSVDFHAQLLETRAGIARDRGVMEGHAGALTLYQLAYEAFLALGDTYRASEALTQLGFCTLVTGRANESLECLLRSAQLSFHPKTRGSAIRDVARVYDAQGQTEIALRYAVDALNIQRAGRIGTIHLARTMQAVAYYYARTNQVHDLGNIIDELHNMPDVYANPFLYYRQLELDAAAAYAEGKLDVCASLLEQAKASQVYSEMPRLRARANRMYTRLFDLSSYVSSELGSLTCILIGADSAKEDRVKLDIIQTLLSHTVSCITIRSEKDLLGESLLDKFKRYLFLAPRSTFIVYECSKPSGAIAELMDSIDSFPIARLRQINKGDSYVVADLGVYHSNVKEFVYDAPRFLEAMINRIVYWAHKKLISSATETAILYSAWKPVRNHDLNNFLLKHS